MILLAAVSIFRFSSEDSIPAYDVKPEPLHGAGGREYHAQYVVCFPNDASMNFINDS